MHFISIIAQSGASCLSGGDKGNSCPYFNSFAQLSLPTNSSGAASQRTHLGRSTQRRILQKGMTAERLVCVCVCVSASMRMSACVGFVCVCDKESVGVCVHQWLMCLKRKWEQKSVVCRRNVFTDDLTKCFLGPVCHVIVCVTKRWTFAASLPDCERLSLGINSWSLKSVPQLYPCFRSIFHKHKIKTVSSEYEGLGFDSWPGQGLSVWSLHVLHAFPSCFLPDL